MQACIKIGRTRIGHAWQRMLMAKGAHDKGHVQDQGCHTGHPEAFWRAYRAGGRAGGPVHYALYKPSGVL
jgi:hypothetical protein